MRAMWGAALLAAVLSVSGPSSEARAEVADVDCAGLKRIAIGDAGSYDRLWCQAGNQSGRSAGGDGNGLTGGYLESIVAYSRASFAVIRLFETDKRTYIPARNVQDHIGATLSSVEPRFRSEERRHGRFALADLDARVMDDAPFLHCVAFVSWMRPVGSSPGYREVVSGLYCAMDRLTPTEAEVAEFLDGLEF